MKKMDSNDVPFLLVAYPWIEDGVFDKAVIMVTESTDEGTMGFILNRPLDNKISEIIVDEQAMIDDDFLIWYGGPVSSEQGYVIHNLGEFDGDSHISDSAGISVNLDSLILLDKMKADSLPDTSVRFVVGYCGWAPGQLDDEFIEGVWMQIPYDEKLVFETPAEEMWEKAFNSVGIHPDLLVVGADTLVQ